MGDHDDDDDDDDDDVDLMAVARPGSCFITINHAIGHVVGKRS